jgi:hypothetical protein
MTNPSWRAITRAKVPAKAEGLWTMVVEHVAGPRLLRISVQEKDQAGAALPTQWKFTATEQCTANGQLRNAACTNALITTAPCGSLIGKIGGSTADMPEEKGVYTGRKVFTVGTYCVVQLAAADSGAVFLTMNDAPENFKDHDLDLHVLIEEAPL